MLGSAGCLIVRVLRLRRWSNGMEQFLWFAIGLAHILAIIWAILVAVLSNIEDDKKDEIRDIG